MVRMAENDVYVVWDDAVTGYNFGPSHPMHPLRLDLTAKLAMDFGLCDADNVHVNPVGPIDEGRLARLHDSDFIAAVKQAGTAEGLDEETANGYGIGTEDVPGVEDMHAARAPLLQGPVDAGVAGCRREPAECASTSLWPRRSPRSSTPDTIASSTSTSTPTTGTGWRSSSGTNRGC